MNVTSSLNRGGKLSLAIKRTAASALAGAMLVSGMPVINASASANPPAPLEDKAPVPEYKITVDYNVVNDYDDGTKYGNVIYIRTRYPEIDNFKNQYCGGPEYDSQSLKNAAKTTGKHSWSFTAKGVPYEVGYCSYGKTKDVSEWYITKITVEPVNIVAGSGKPKSVVFWEGTFGTKTKGIGGKAMSSHMIINDYGVPELKSWEGIELKTDKYFDKIKLGVTDGPYIDGVTALESEYTDVYVPDYPGTHQTYEVTGGVSYDQYGAEYVDQTGVYTTDHKGVYYQNGSFFLTGDANAKEDYTVTVTKTMHYGFSNSEYKATKSFKVHTFDYTVNFIDGYGKTLKSEVVDYGGSSTPPSVPKYIRKGNSFWKFSYWNGSYKNLTYAKKICDVDADYYYCSPFFSGSGTENDPYRIESPLQWEQMSEYCKSVDTSKTYFKLAKDLTVDTMVGNPDFPFKGIFDGAGNTLTLNYDTSEEFTAPFRYTSDAVIKNLHTAGTVKTSSKYGAGVIAHSFKNTKIENCRSSVTIESTVDGDGSHGGLVAVAGKDAEDTLDIIGCLFDGKFHGSKTIKCGGFIGWRNKAAVIRDSIFDPSEITSNQSDCAMFGRNKVDTDNSYYLSAFGFDTGKQWLAGHTILTGKNTEVEFENEGKEYNVSGITSYGTGLLYNGKKYAGKGETVSLKLGSTAPEGMTCTGYTVNIGELEGSESSYKLTMPDTDPTVSAVFDKTHVHIYHDKVTKPATCTEDGIITYSCDCGDSYTEVIPALGHDFSDKWTIDLEPTCTEPGIKSHHCKRCDETKDETVIPALGHSWDEGVVTKEATLDEDGEITYTCTVCGETKTEIIPAKHHYFDEPECKWEKNGNTYTAKFNFTCKDCGEIISYDADVTSETADGKITYTAVVTVAGKQYTDTLTVNETEDYTAPEITAESGTNAVKLSWTGVEGADKYAVIAYVNGTWTKLAEGNTNTYTIKDLKAGVKYKVAVIAQVGGKWYYDVSNAIIVAPKAEVYPEAKAEVQGNAFRLSWTTVPNAQKYVIAYTINGKTWKVLKAVDANTTSFTCKNIPNGTYYLAVGAYVNGKIDTNGLNNRAVKVVIK